MVVVTVVVVNTNRKEWTEIMRTLPFDLSSNPEDPISTQPQQQSTNDTVFEDAKFTIYEDEHEIKITKCFEPPPPYSEQNDNNPVTPSCSNPGVSNYGATD
ncbi:hypothetical protein Mgra_00000186 [Meloidogyne graminicola]|uniref:Uncharacterized protein n=1 Tax=Meloidogyne graminicola TaxID=189291 RepID=A0A8T0A4Y4_9BILA|nr:hypothetical protein Mgra_00000186 [Meloidogyne graminicola]